MLMSVVPVVVEQCEQHRGFIRDPAARQQLSDDCSASPVSVCPLFNQAGKEPAANRHRKVG